MAGTARKRKQAPPHPAPPKASPSRVAFPLRCAALDMGSNAIRLLAAEFTSPSVYRILLNERVPVRLGHAVFLSGRLAPEAVDAAVRALKGYRRKLAALRVTHERAAATSAVRESTNGEAFLERVRRETGFDLSVISGVEEARLIHLAVRRRIPMGTKEWLLADLGGGSVEVSLADGSGVLWSESHTMGAVRLLEELSASADEPGRLRTLLEEYTSTLRVPPAALDRRPLGYIATGGNIEAIAALIGTKPGPRGVSTVSMPALKRLVQRLAGLSFNQRVRALKLKPDRADVILPAAVVYERLGLLAGARGIHVPGVGLKEGLLFDLVDSLSAADHESAGDRQALEAAAAIGRRYLFDEAHGRHVADLATSLFDQLSALHRLGPHDRRILTAAALLHDTGSYVSFKGHHRHSCYLITHSELPGFSPRDMLVAANVARYHRKGLPKLRHEPYASLLKGERSRVEALAALLRVADALDREHRQGVRHAWAKVEEGRVRLTLEGDGDCLLERWALKRKADLFEARFQRRVVVAQEGGKP